MKSVVGALLLLSASALFAQGPVLRAPAPETGREGVHAISLHLPPAADVV